jgi:hypothetical protein
MADPIAMTDDEKHLKGSCLCGAVGFKIDGRMRPIVACHCGQCRKQTSHFFAATNAESEDITFSETRGLTWFKSSDIAERGFCRECGSMLFWRRSGSSTLSISAGSLDGETGLFICEHIYVADKPDWYEITDGKPQFQVWR